MIEMAIIVMLLDTGDEVRTRTPLASCLAMHREWRYLDASGRGRMVALDKESGAKRIVRSVRCEPVPSEVPAS